MFKAMSKESPVSKCYVSRGGLPKHIDAAQMPSKKNPFAAILNQPFTHTVHSYVRFMYHSPADDMVGWRTSSWRFVSFDLGTCRGKNWKCHILSGHSVSFWVAWAGFSQYIHQKWYLVIWIPLLQLNLFFCYSLVFHWFISRRCLDVVRGSSWNRQFVHAEKWYAILNSKSFMTCAAVFCRLVIELSRCAEDGTSQRKVWTLWP